MDRLHDRVFLAGFARTGAERLSMGVAVMSSGGQLQQRLLQDRDITGIALSGDDTVLAVTYDETIAIYDAASLTLRRTFTLPQGTTPSSVAVAGGRVWFELHSGCCYSQLDSADLTTGAQDINAMPYAARQQAPLFATSAANPDLLIVSADEGLSVHDVSGGGDRTVAQRSYNDVTDPLAIPDPASIEVSPDGREVVVADGSATVKRYSTTDLSLTGSVPVGTPTRFAAISPDGASVATLHTDSPDSSTAATAIHVTPLTGGSFRTIVTPPYTPRSLGWTADGAVLAVMTDFAGHAQFLRCDDPALRQTTVELPQESQTVGLGQSVTVYGDVVAVNGSTVTPTPGAASVTREGPDGMVTVPVSFVAQPDGRLNFTVHDLPLVPGEYRYRVNYAGAPGLGSSSGSTHVSVTTPTAPASPASLYGLPGGIVDMVADPLTKEMFVRDYSSGLAAVDAEGLPLGHVDLPGITGMVLSPDSANLYVVRACAEEIDVLDSLTLATVRRIDMASVAPHPLAAAFSGADFYVLSAGDVFTQCPSRPSPTGQNRSAAVVSVPLGDPSAASPLDLQGYRIGDRPAFGASPAVPGELVLDDSYGDLLSVSVAGPAVTSVERRAADDSSRIAFNVLRDGSFYRNGKLLSRSLNLLSDLPATSVSPDGSHFAAPADRRIIIRGSDGTNFSSATMSALTTSGQFNFGVNTTAFSADGQRLYVATTGNQVGDVPSLIVINLGVQTLINLVTPAIHVAGVAEHIAGQLITSGLPVTGTVELTRTDGSLAAATVTSAPIGSSGAFDLSDTPTTPGPWTYRVTYSGDQKHQPAGAAVVVDDVPTAVTQLGVIPAPGALRMTWNPPTSDGGTAVTGYSVSVDGANQTLAAGVTSLSLTGLAGASTHTITVAARNAIGSGPSTRIVAATLPLPVPVDPIVAKGKAVAATIGLPVGAEYAVAGGRAQNYQRGRVYYSATTGAREVDGPILTRYLALGGPAARGLPTTDEASTYRHVGRYSQFTRACIYWTSTTGAHAVTAIFLATYAHLGKERSWLGYPKKDMYPAFGGQIIDFQHGHLVYNTVTKKVTATH